MKRLVRLASRTLLALVLLPLVAELGLRVAGKKFRFPTPCTWNPRVGCLLRPNLDEELAVWGHTFRFTTNADGRRDRPRGPKAPGVRRILVLGDSVAFGAGVPFAETFAARLESQLAPQKVEVLNGASIYLRGTEQQLSYFVDFGAALAPDLVLLTFSAQNDFADNVHRYFWRRGPAGLERVAHTEPPSRHQQRVLLSNDWPLVRWLDDHSWLFGLFRLSAWNIMHLPPAASYDQWQEATEDVVVRLREEAAGAGAKLAILLVPSPRTVERLRRGEPLAPASDEARIAAIAARRQIALLDLTPLIVAAPLDDALQTDDGHLTARGHAVAAAALAATTSRWLATGRSGP